MPQYDITLNNEKIRSYNRIGWICIFIHFLIFTYAALLSTEEAVYKGGAVAIIVAGALVGFIAWRGRKKGVPKPVMLSIYIALVVGWIIMENYLFTLIPVLFAVMYLIATRDFVVHVNEEQVLYPSFPEKKIAWADLRTILLKDGLLTIELPNDKLIQQLVVENKTTVNEPEFNEFCKTQRLKAKEKRA